ncbi:MAG TPA: sugar phosphate isomerase/epimerase family protein [Bacillales bacterium]|nr:sugar phosphate isomerase/epimerase family protein [Bacillales bacterium]
MKVGLATASYFAKPSNYSVSMDDWGEAERRVIETFCLQEFQQLCTAIAGAGFRCIELWMGHAFPKFMTQDLADEMKMIAGKSELEMIGFTCHLGDPLNYPRWTELCFRTSRMFGIDLITSGVTKQGAPIVNDYCEQYGIKVAVENHPEKHPDEILEVIEPYRDWLGAGVDTGWFGTQGFPPEKALELMGDRLFNVHLKDVKEVGSHHPVALGSGVVDIEQCVRTLKQIGYDDRVSVEQESEDHDPTRECGEALQMIEELLSH